MVCSHYCADHTNWNRGFYFLHGVYIWRVSLHLLKHWVWVWGCFISESQIKIKVENTFCWRMLRLNWVYDPLGYVAGSAAPEQTGTEADIVFGIDSSSESPTTPTTKALPEVDAAKSTEKPLTEVIPKEENVSSPEPEPRALEVKGLPAEGNGATGKRNRNLGRLVSRCMCRWVHTTFVLSVVSCLIVWRMLVVI